jgi:dipeptidyl aminopeptidase/acylaminoacyl peptidase
MSDQNVPLIPREILFGNPDKASPLLSPDGNQIGYLAPLDGVLNVWVGHAHDIAAARPVTNDTGRGIRFFTWAYTNRHILYVQDKNGDENWRIFSVDLENGEIHDLTPIEGAQAQIQKVSHLHPEEILIAINDINPQFHSLYRLNLKNGERTLVLENDRFADFAADDHLNVRFGFQSTPDGGMNMVKIIKPGEYEQYKTIGQEDSLSTYPIGFDLSGKIFYLSDSTGRDTSALIFENLETGERTVAAENERADLGNVLIHPTKKTIQAVSFNYERDAWQVLDPDITGDFHVLRDISPGDFSISSRTLDDHQWIVVYNIDNGPVRYYRYDRQSRSAQFLFTNRQDLEGLPLAKMHPVVVSARDGLNLVNYYTLPSWSDPSHSGKPKRPLSMVMVVHGGPWGRDEWGYNPWHQWLANRGYAVLSVNFRGSTGFGKRFINAGNFEWAGTMHSDLVDSVEWAVQSGIADPQKVAIIGGSYGGYATLVGLTFTPDLFTCGVDIVGPSNLITLLETIPPYWQPILELFTTRVGDHRTEEGRALLRERSPLTHVDRIQRPLLIGQGANDPRVKQSESDQIVEAMKEKNIPVTYVLYPDEGHGFARPQNRLSFFAITEAFLSRCMGGRYQPVGSDFEGSSLQVLHGAEEIPGLTEALSGE